MQTATTIGLDIAKSVFQVHGTDAEGKVLIRRKLKRRYVLAFFQKLPPCLVGIEACATSHHWSRELKTLGHTVRLMPPAYVKPYVKRQKNDATDAEAEAVTRANMRFVETKTPEQQSCLMLHRTRQLFIRHQTSVINAIRAHMAEFGIVAPVGRQGVEGSARGRRRCGRQSSTRGGTCVSRCPWCTAANVEGADPRVRPPDPSLAPIQCDEPTARCRSGHWTGAGHRSGRQRCRCEGLPLGTELLRLDRARTEATLERGKDKLGSITKQGDRYLRSLFTAGALAVIRYAKTHGTQHRPWLTALLARRPTKVAAIALANKLARMAWAMMARDEHYQEPAALAA
jgi:transposase